MGKAIRVLLVDDHEFAREGLRHMLELHPEIEVVGEAASAQEAVSLVDSLAPDIVLMDIKMPDMNGLEATRLLKERATCEVVILSLYDEYLAQAMEAGAAGYLTKDVKRMELATAVRRVHNGELVLGTSLLSNPQAAETALRHLREVVRGRQAPSSGPEAKAPPMATTAPPIVGPDPGASPAADQKQTPPTASGPQSPSLDDTVDGQDSQSRSHPPTAPTASGPPPWEPAPWAVPLKIEGQPAPPQGKGGPVAYAAAPQSPPSAPREPASYEATGIDTPFSMAGKAAGMTEAELVLPPPLDAARLMRFFHRLEEAADAKVVGTLGSWKDGAIMKVAFHRSVSLVEVLHLMPEVAEAWEESPPKPRGPFKGRGKARPLTEGQQRIRLLLKDATDPAQLTFRL